MLATEKQRQFVAGIVHKMRYSEEAFQRIIESIPRNNEQYPDTRADYRILILADQMKGLSMRQADYIIKTWKGVEGFNITKAGSIVASSLSLNTKE